MCGSDNNSYFARAVKRCVAFSAIMNYQLTRSAKLARSAVEQCVRAIAAPLVVIQSSEVDGEKFSLSRDFEHRNAHSGSQKQTWWLGELLNIVVLYAACMYIRTY